MTDGTIEDQTRVVLDAITDTLKLADCHLSDVVKAMVWLRDRTDFPGFDSVYAEYFPKDPPARSAVISELLVDVRVEIEVVAYHPSNSMTRLTHQMEHAIILTGSGKTTDHILIHGLGLNHQMWQYQTAAALTAYGQVLCC